MHAQTHMLHACTSTHICTHAHMHTHITRILYTYYTHYTCTPHPPHNYAETRRATYCLLFGFGGTQQSGTFASHRFFALLFPPLTIRCREGNGMTELHMFLLQF